MTTMPIGDILRHQAARKPDDATAISYPDATLTWRELDERSNQLARLYQSMGVVQGDRVGIALENGTAYHETSFALWKLGASPAALSPKLSAAEFSDLADLIKPKLIVSNSANVEDLPIASVGTGIKLISFDNGPLESEIAPYWKISTSGGSTGRPKAIVHNVPGTFDPETDAIRDEFLMEPDSVVLNPGPLYHNAPFLFSSYGLFTGSTVIGMNRFDPEEALRLIQEHRVTWVLFVPTMMHRIWSLPKEVRERYDLSSLKTVWHMASVCPPWLKEAWLDWLGPERIWERYGGTEGFGSTVISGTDWLKRRGSIGRPTARAPIKIVRDDGEPCDFGEVGEMYFLPNSDQPPSFYIGAEARKDGDGWYSLGDLGHQDVDGYVYLADRRTDLIIRGGANIYPAEIEAALDAYPDIGSSIVVGLPCDELGARVHAIIEAKDGTTIDLADVHRFMKQQVVTYKLPESYEVLNESLRDDAGKARRTALRQERLDWLKEGRPFKASARELAKAGS